MRRIINVPKRGIGAATLMKVQMYATERDMSFYEALEDEGISAAVGRSGSKLVPFVSLIQRMRSQLEYLSVSELLTQVIEETGYVKELEAEGTDESRARIENIDELLTKAVTYEEEHETPTLDGFLEEVALIADIDTVEDGDDRVLLMTLHSAKDWNFHTFIWRGWKTVFSQVI